jgi:hypothetical protein
LPSVKFILTKFQDFMKRFAFIFLLLTALFTSCKHDEQIPVVQYPEFNIVNGSSASNQVHAAARSLDEGYVLAGSAKTESVNPGNSDVWVLHLDYQGKIIWQKTFGGSANDGAYSVASTKDGGFVIAGYTYSTDGDIVSNHGNSDAWVIKINKTGSKEWQSTLGGSASDVASSIVETSDGGYIMAGQTASTDGDVSNNHGSMDAWVAKLDRNGNKQWQRTFGGTGSEGAQSIMETSEGGYIMAGWTNSNDGDVTGYHVGWGMNTGNFDGWVVRLNKDGNLLWNKAFGGSRNEVFNTITHGMDNSYTLAGYTRSNFDGDVGANHGDLDAWVVNIDNSGKIVWQKPLGGSNGDVANFIASTRDGGYIFVGFTSSNDGDVRGNHGGEDAWVVKLDQGGKKQWQSTLGGSGNDLARTVFQRANGTYVMVGSTSSNDGDLTGQYGAGGAWIITMKDQ